MKSSTQRVRRTPEAARQQLIDAAEAALDRAETGTLTVAAVTQEAGMTRSAFYHYFAGLDELVLEVLDRYEGEIRETVNPWLDGSRAVDDYRAATVKHLSDMFVVMRMHRNILRAAMHAASGSSSVYESWRERAVDYFIDRTERFIVEQIALGRSKVDDPARVAKSLILMNYGVFADNTQRDEPDDPLAIGHVIGGIWNAVIYGPEPALEAGAARTGNLRGSNHDAQSA